MIVSCESCQTRFQLDDARVPPGGVRVRCSCCSHAFNVIPPDTPPDTPDLNEHTRELLTTLAEDSWSESGSSLTPDLSPIPGSSAGPPTSVVSRVAEAEGEGDEESDWQFNDQPPAMEIQNPEDEEPESERSFAIDSACPEPPVPDRDSLDDLGHPESWDFFTEQEDVAEAVTPLSPAAPTAARGVEAAAEPQGSAEEPDLLPERQDPLIDHLGWVVAVLLLGVVLHGTLFAAPPRHVPAADRLTIDGLRAEGLHGETVENAVGGRLFVVSGTLTNPGTTSQDFEPLQVSFRRADGSRLPAEAEPLGHALAEERLRQDTPARLQARIRASAAAWAARPLAPGERRPFAVVFPGLPEGAESFLLEEASAGFFAPSNALSESSSEAGEVSRPPSPDPSPE